MAELKEKKFGYVVCPPHHHCIPPCPPGPIPQGMTVKDWTEYINSYIDVRARQIYDKLKNQLPSGGGGSGPYNEIELRDIETGEIYKLYISDGTLYTDKKN